MHADRGQEASDLVEFIAVEAMIGYPVAISNFFECFFDDTLHFVGIDPSRRIWQTYAYRADLQAWARIGVGVSLGNRRD